MRTEIFTDSSFIGLISLLELVDNSNREQAKVEVEIYFGSADGDFRACYCYLMNGKQVDEFLAYAKEVNSYGKAYNRLVKGKFESERRG